MGDYDIIAVGGRFVTTVNSSQWQWYRPSIVDPNALGWANNTAPPGGDCIGIEFGTFKVVTYDCRIPKRILCE